MFEKIIGHNNIKMQLDRILSDNRLANAYLFSGPPKVGKFSMAMEFAVQIMGERFRNEIENFIFPDFTVIYPFLKKDIASKGALLENLRMNLIDKHRERASSDMFDSISTNANIPIDIVRELILFTGKKSFISDKRVIIIKNAEKMRKEGANSFLKLLEEPPKNTVFILTTDNLSIILPTIISRCQLIRFGYIANGDISSHIDPAGIKTDTEWIYDGTFGNMRFNNILIKLTDRNAIAHMVLKGEEDQLNSMMKKIERDFLKGNKDKGIRTINVKHEMLLFIVKTLMLLINALLIEDYQISFDENIMRSMKAKFSADDIMHIENELMTIESDMRKNITFDKTLKYIITLFSVKGVHNVYTG